MLKKLIPHGGKPANYTLRFTKDVSSAIRERAKALNMSQSYYVAALYKLDSQFGLVEQLGDLLDTDLMPTSINVEEEFGVKSQVTTEPTDLQARIDSRQREIDSMRAQVEDPTPPPKAERQRPRIVPPKMVSLNELLLQDRGGQTVTSAPSTGGAMLRQMQQQQLKEEREERELRRKILDDLAKEQEDE